MSALEDAGGAPAEVPSPGQPPGRIRRSAGQARRWLEAERRRLQEELDAGRQRSGMVDAGFQLQELDSQVGGGILAGALAFRIFLFMVPFVYVVFTVLGSASGALSQDPAHLARDLGITGVLASAVVKAQDQSAWTLAFLVAGAAVALFLTADVLHLLTTYWIGHLVARKTSTYGSVGIALAVLLWVYILGRIIVASAGLNAALYRRQNQ